MSSKGRGNGRGNKRKFPDQTSFNSKKKNDMGFQRNDGRWNNKYRYNVNNKIPNHGSRNDVHNRNGYMSRYYNSYAQKNFDYTSHISTESHIEQETDMTGDSLLNSERLEKVLATKKRIEEAFASKPSNSSNREMAFEKPVIRETGSTDNKEKNTEGSIPVDSLDLRLTNSDFKEIGSVASGVEVAMETDLILNVASCSSQQRSFDKMLPPTVPSTSKEPRISGWNITALNESEAGPFFTKSHGVPSRTSRTIREQYLQESREEILGIIEQNAEKQITGHTTTKTDLGIPKPPRTYNSRVGQLYQSFLRSRLFGGFTLKLSKNVSKPTGPNPLLDKSVLESHINYNQMADTQVLQLEMPRPIMIKLEANNTQDLEGTPNHMEAEEANEFCQEFSHLLTEPNFLIPSEELEKLGLGHLAEMNKLVNERRAGNNPPNMSANSENYLRVRSLNALNSVTENDITYYPPISNLTPSPLPDPPSNNNFSHTPYVQRNLQDLNYEFVNVAGVNRSQTSGLNSQVLTNPQPSIMAQDATLEAIHTPVAESLTVESVAEKVVEKLLSSTNKNPQASNPHAEFLVRHRILQPNMLANQNETPPPVINNSFGHSNTHSTGPTNQLQDIGDKILRMFVIDKQMENLMQEKKAIYNELLSIGEISSSLFNSWAQEKIEKRNVNVPSEQPHDSTSNTYHTNPIPNIPSSNPGLINNLIPPAQSKVVEPCATGNLNHMSSTSFEPSSPLQWREPNQPKLSIRKDLHKTIKEPVSKNNLLNKHTGEGSEVFRPDTIVKTESCTDTVFENNSRKGKKKKKEKDKEKPENIIYLIDDSTDEESCNVSVSSSSVSIDLLASDESFSKAKNNEPDIIYNYALFDNTPMCICLCKGVLVVGCKDGTVIMYEVKDCNPVFFDKLHEESINCLAVVMKQAIFGSNDATISLFSLEKQKKTQTVQTPSSVQCIEVNCDKLYVGTKTGQFITYKIIVKINDKGYVEMCLKGQETKKFSNSSIIDLKVTEMEGEEVVIVASRGEQIAVYYTDTGLLLTTFDWCDTVHCLTVLSQKPIVFCGTNTQSIKVVNFVTGGNEPDCLVGTARSITKIILKSTVLFAASTDGKVYIYDTKVNKLITAMVACKGQILGMQLYKKLIICASNRSELNAVPIPSKVDLLLRKSTKSKST